MNYIYIIIIVIIVLLFIYFARQTDDEDEDKLNNEEDYKNLVKKDINKAREVIKDDLKTFELFQDS